MADTVRDSAACEAQFAAAVQAVLARYADIVSGELLAEVICLKGEPGQAELAGMPVCSGADGEALDKALVALGYDSGCWLAVDCSRGLDAAGLREIAEAVDPLAIVALDGVAARLLASAYGIGLAVGGFAEVAGRGAVALDGFERSLADEQAKRAAWRLLKLLPRARKLI